MGRRAMSQLDDGAKRTGPAMLQPWCASMQAGMRGGRYIFASVPGAGDEAEENTSRNNSKSEVSNAAHAGQN